MKRSFYLIALIVFLPVFVIAQQEDKAQLEKERQEIQNEIKQINGSLVEARVLIPVNGILETELPIKQF